jgi:Fur family transcriptional regulator, ferric uptake regulator
MDQTAPENEPIRDRVRSVGLRATAARIAVLRVLSEANTPLSHADVAEKLSAAGFDRVTVYRNLMELADAGIASRVDLGDHTWRFEVKSETSKAHVSEHPHFVCVDCGEVSCLPGVSVSVVEPKDTKAPPVVRQITEVLLKGHCGNCS